MTIQEMKTEFLIDYDRRSSLSASPVEDAEISKFLNDGQESLINEWYSVYDKGEIVSKHLSELIRFASINIFTVGNHPNSFFVELPDRFWRSLKEEVSINYTDSCGNVITGKRIPVVPMDRDYYNKYINNYYKKPNENRIWRFDHHRTNTTQNVVWGGTNFKRHELITFAGSTITNYMIEYFKYPALMDITNNVDCELDPAVQKEIIHRAVTKALEVVADSRLQTQVQVEP